MDMASMPLFDKNPMHPLNQMPLPAQKRLLADTLVQFREFPLCAGGYDEEGLRFYDGVLGNLIRTRDSYIENEIYHQVVGFAEFASHWEYRGDIYRVLGKSYVQDEEEGEPRLEMPEINWHGMIASWSKSYDFTTGFSHINSRGHYTFIHARTLGSAGIDANKFSQYLDCFNQNLADEEEVIFPMKRRHVVKVYKNMTPGEFKEIMDASSWMEKASAMMG